MDATTVGIIGFAAMLGLMFLGVPIGVSMGAVGFFGYAWVNGWDSALNMLSLAPYSAVATYVLTVVPLFVLMGHIANETGIGRELYATAQIWLRHRRGGLAMATIAACAGFAAISGSSVATAATMTTVALPQMRKMGYDPKLATGSVAAGGTLGILIPPSVIFLIYGFLTEQSIGKLFLAGILPGILLTVMFIITIAIVTWHNPALAPLAETRATIPERLRALRDVWAVAALFALVIGGMYAGAFTATEAAAMGAFGTLIVALLRGRLTWASLLRSLGKTAETVAIVTVILIGAVVLGYFLAITQLPSKLAQTLADSGLSPTSIMLMIIVAYLIMGAFMDELAMILLTVPILFPVTQAIGYDPIWFGVIIVVVCQAGMIAPPVGLNVFVISGMVKDVPMQDIYRGILPFLAAMVLLLGILMLVPDIALYLPRTMK
jgi:tripartite ATP-independent transporter DctM subunit